MCNDSRILESVYFISNQSYLYGRFKVDDNHTAEIITRCIYTCCYLAFPRVCMCVFADRYSFGYTYDIRKMLKDTIYFPVLKHSYHSAQMMVV